MENSQKSSVQSTQRSRDDVRTASIRASLIAATLATFASASAQDFAADTQILQVTANDIAYSAANGVLYATVPSAAGFPNGNAVATIDPNSGAVVDSVFAGSEPTRIVVSEDGSQAYIGINGARAFRSWTPGTSNFGLLIPLTARFDDPAVAANMAILPGQPNVVVVSKDEVGSSASGDLELFRNNVSLGELGTGFPDADQVLFSDETTMITYNDSSTGFDLQRWAFDPVSYTATVEDEIDGLVSGFSTRIEVVDGVLFSSNGIVVSVDSLTAIGTFNTGLTGAAVETVPELDLTFFLGTESFSTNELVLSVFDTATFLPVATLDLGITLGFSEDVTDLVYIGDLKFAWLTDEGRVGITTVVPVPPGIILFVSALSLLGASRSRRKLQA